MGKNNIVSTRYGFSLCQNDLLFVGLDKEKIKTHMLYNQKEKVFYIHSMVMDLIHKMYSKPDELSSFLGKMIVINLKFLN